MKSVGKGKQPATDYHHNAGSSSSSSSAAVGGRYGNAHQQQSPGSITIGQRGADGGHYDAGMNGLAPSAMSPGGGGGLAPELPPAAR